MRGLSPKLKVFFAVCVLAGGAGGVWLATQVEDGREQRRQSR